MKANLKLDQQIELKSQEDKTKFLFLFETLHSLNAQMPSKTNDALIESMDPTVRKIQGDKYGIYRAEIRSEIRKLKKNQH